MEQSYTKSNVRRRSNMQKKGKLGGYIQKEENLSQEGDACLKSDVDHCVFDCFGSSNRHTHAYLTRDNAVEITCGCFRGSIEEFEKKVKNTHAGTVYENQYNAIINVIKIKFGSAQRQDIQA